jgi:glycosyltransferase involved in cell wall biosynthesis
MLWLIGLLVCETACEGLLCGGGLALQPWQRKLACILTGLILASVLVVLSIAMWRVWLWSLPIGAYRLINLLRLYYDRLPRPRLRSVAVQAFGWLVAAQIVVTLIAWSADAMHVDHTLLAIVMVSQLLGAAILLRATLRTWQHATAPAGQKPLSDRELPSLSVLVPARNETQSLDTCLQVLTASDYPKLEILVLDDCSATRQTPEIIRSFAQAGVRFIQGETPDLSHWLPKSYAYDQLTREASGDLLLFCGVDTILKPQSIRKLVTILEERQKNMLSVLPLRRHIDGEDNSLFQAMRYYWELCLPRRVFKRPPVLSTCWLIRRDALEKMGGFEAVSHSVSPEASFARRAVTTDSYSFIRSDDVLGVYSNKPASEQYATSVRVRYPQLHRRLELVALVSLAEIIFLLGPMIGLILAGGLKHSLEYVLTWSVVLVGLFVTYSFAAVRTRLSNPTYGWLLMPAAFVLDLVVLHISLWKYEFGEVTWKGRNVCLPVMQLPPPKAPPDM